MALKPCEQCKHAIRSEDSRCPHCGWKQPGAPSQVGKVALVCFALGAGWWVFDVTSTASTSEKKVAAATHASAAAVKPAVQAAPLSDLERTLQERCGKQTDENGNWIVKGAENRARCRVQVELELEHKQREERIAAQQVAPGEQLAHRVESPRADLPHENPARAMRTARSRPVRHEPLQRSTQAAPVASPAAQGPSEPSPAKEKGGFGPGDDLQPLVPAAGALTRDPVPGEPMFVKPDAAFL